jgi:hypothetical protein
VYWQKHITHQELKAVTENIHAFADQFQLQNHSAKELKLWKDNQTVVAIVNAMVSKAQPL